MIPTYVFGWPTGEERGDFLAIDLGEWRYLPIDIMPNIEIGRRHESPNLSGNAARIRQIRDYTIEIPSFRRTEEWRRSRSIRLLRGVFENVHR